MIVQIVKFETSLPEEELVSVAKSRLDDYRATPGLIEKFYCKYPDANVYGGILIWDSMESIKAFSETDLSKTIGAAYKVIGQPESKILDSLFELRDMMSEAA